MTYIPPNANGQATMANSEPVVIASDQGAVPVSGTVTANIGTVATLATAAKQDTGNTSVASIDTKTPALGQALAAASVPVILPAATVTTLTPPAAITGFGTAANQTTIIGHIDGIETLLTTIEGDTTAIQTAVQLLDDTVATLGTDTYTEATTKGITIGAVRRDANTSLANTTNEITPLQVNATGELKVAQIAALPTGANVIGALTANQSVNAAQINGVTPLMGNGASGTGALRVSLASDSTGNIASIGTSVTPGTAAANLGKARDSAIGATDTGVAILGVRRDTPTAETPIAGDYIVPQYSANGEAWVRSVAVTSGGATPYKLVSAATTNATSVKASAGQVYMITASNVNAAARYLKLYNKASAPTVGTDVPVHTFIIPGNTAGAGTNIPVPACGLAFSTGIAFALTTEATDAGTTAVLINEIVINLAWT